MSTNTSIEWTDATWSPIRARRRDTGKIGQHCERVSPGCTNCYAARHNGRNLPNGGTGLDYTRPSRDLVETFVDDRVLLEPLRWRTPKRIFVENQSDLFGEWVTDEQIDRVFGLMAHASWHTFQVLTKRPKRMRAWFEVRHLLEPNDNPAQFPPLGTHDRVWSRMPHSDEIQWPRPEWPLPNVWLGVSAEDQQRADERIPILLDTPAAVRFVSVEPMIGPSDLSIYVSHLLSNIKPHSAQLVGDRGVSVRYDADVRSSLDWVIVGGESGPGARPCDVAWIRSIVEQCRVAGTACFVKQLGARIEVRNDQLDQFADPDRVADTIDDRGGNDGRTQWQGKPVFVRMRDAKGGDPSEWPVDLRVREFPREAVRA